MFCTLMVTPGYSQCSSRGSEGAGHAGEQVGSFFADPGMDKFVHAIGRVPKTAICNPASSVASLHAAMAPHLTPAEQDAIFSAKEAGKTVEQIWELVKKWRATAGTPMVNITVLRHFMRGRAHKRGKVETRGRPRARGTC